VCLRPYTFNGHDYDDWDKVGEAVGNFQALERLRISSLTVYDSDGDSYYSSDDDLDEDVVIPIPDWEILARILKHVRNNVTVIFKDERLWTIEEVQPFARAICGHPTITGFDDSGRFPYESLDTLFSTLATLPALESVSFVGAPEVRHADESTLANPGSLTELLRVPSLRSVSFRRFSFTPALFQSSSKRINGRHSSHQARVQQLLVFCRRKCCKNGERSQQKYISDIHHCPVRQCSSAFRRPGNGSSVKFHVTASCIGPPKQ
jgi:hypothetical protein